MNSISLFQQSIKVILLTMLVAVPLTTYGKNKSSSPSTLTYEPQLENQRDPNDYCAKCHKFDKLDKDQVVESNGEFHFGKFHGKHLSQKNPNTGKPITCIDCHGNISEDHRRGAKDVMRFEGDIFAKKKPLYTVEQQNQVCFACHRPDKLREKFWVHDVHAMKLPCASCHTLHPQKDAMKDISHKDQVKLCVDCHGKQQARQAEKQLNKYNSNKG